MQYQSSLDREGLAVLALEKYFANVDAKNLDAVMDCFHDNAMLTVQNVFVVHDTKDAIRRMLSILWLVLKLSFIEISSAQ